MKTIKIKFTDFWPGFNYQNNYFTKLLSQKYDVQISDEPDYVIASVAGNDYLKYDCIRIWYSGENLHPDFDLFDYGISFDDRLKIDDRYIRYPIYCLNENRWEAAKHKHEFDEQDYFKKHSRFCNFVYSNGKNAVPFRENIFQELSKYKKVDSGGRLHNNIGGPVEDKADFMPNYKFTIAVENTSAPGYTTEKLLDAWAYGTVPIYYGNPDIGKEFNDEAFINCHKYNSIEEIVQRVKELDEDDEKFMAMMKASILREDCYAANYEEKLLNFFSNIFEQEYEKAFRRDRFGYGKIYEERIRRMATYSIDGIYHFLQKIKGK
ncbi:MAG: glycosyltransferase family 10 domain-containing protein [Agathobacter sp.]